MKISQWVILGTYNTKHFLVISKFCNMVTRGTLEEFEGDFEFSQLTFTSVSITELDRDKDKLFPFFTKSKNHLEKEKKSLAHFGYQICQLFFNWFVSLFRQRFVSFSTHFLTWWFVISTDIAWGRVLMLEVTSGSQSFEKTLRTRMDTSKFLCTHKSQTRRNLNLLELLRHNANTGFLSLFLFLQKSRARFRRWLRKFCCCTSHEERKCSDWEETTFQ